MQKLSETDILSRIADEQHFEAEISDGSFVLKIEAYVPAVCAAIHAGHSLRESLEPLC